MNDDENVLQDRRVMNFDHDSCDHAENWLSVFNGLREECPRAWTDSHGGYWVATRYKDIVAIAQGKDEFTAAKSYDPETGTAIGGVTIPPFPFRFVPNETDFPEWQGFRTFLNRHFSPKAVEMVRPRAARFAAALIDEVIETGRFDIVDSLASPLPALMTMDILGLPLDRWELFSDGYHKLVYLTKDDPQLSRVLNSLEELRTLIGEELEKRRSHPRDDLLTALVHGSIDGQPIPVATIQEIVNNVAAGGVDTTTALTSNALLYLARQPDERQRLIDKPEMLSLACEEFVRFFSPIQGLARSVKQNATIDGWTFAKDERILLAYVSGNHDPRVFDDPDTLKLDRYPNRHIGFGAGMHRCMGSYLARMMFETMVTEVLGRMPDYRVEADHIAPYPSRATVNGWITIPATFTPGPKLGVTLYD